MDAGQSIMLEPMYSTSNQSPYIESCIARMSQLPLVKPLAWICPTRYSVPSESTVRLAAYSLKEGVPMYLTQSVFRVSLSHAATKMSRKPQERSLDIECPITNSLFPKKLRSIPKSGFVPPKLVIQSKVPSDQKRVIKMSIVPQVYSTEQP